MPSRPGDGAPRGRSRNRAAAPRPAAIFCRPRPRGAGSAGLFPNVPGRGQNISRPGPPAHAVADSDRSLRPEAREAIPEMAPELQKTVLLNTGTAHIRLIIGQAALLQHTGGTDVMIPQLRHLAELGARPELRVLPLRSLSHPAPWAGSMTLLEYSGVPGLTGVVHLGGPDGGLFLDDHDIPRVIRVTPSRMLVSGKPCSPDTAPARSPITVGRLSARQVSHSTSRTRSRTAWPSGEPIFSLRTDRASR